MCNYNNVGKIVEEMLNFNEETDMTIKEELVLKIAILSEKFAPNLTWYIDVVIRLLSKSGDYGKADYVGHRKNLCLLPGLLKIFSKLLSFLES